MSGSPAPELIPVERDSSAPSEDLLKVIGAFCYAETLAAREAAFVNIVRWTRAGQRSRGGAPRLLSLVQLLENDTELRRQVQLSLGELLREVSLLDLRNLLSQFTLLLFLTLYCWEVRLKCEKVLSNFVHPQRLR